MPSAVAAAQRMPQSDYTKETFHRSDDQPSLSS